MPTITQVYLPGGGSGSDGTVNTGTALAQVGVSAALDAKDAGTGSTAVGVAARAATLSEGAAVAALAATETGAGAQSTGSQGRSMAVPTLAAGAQTVGAQGRSLAASSSVLAVARPTVAAQTDLGGLNNVANWTTIDAAKSDSDSAATAAITAAATATIPSGFNDRLDLTTFGIPGTPPPGWTRTLVNLKVRFGYDLTWTRVIGSSLAKVELTKSDGTVVSTLHNVSTNTTLAIAEVTYDVTAAVAALTAAEINGLQVRITAQANIEAGVGNNASMTVDYAKFEITYTRSAIT